MMKKPNLFVVGEQKAGTTALHELLKQHPGIFMSDLKEPGFFCKDFHKESDKFHHKRLFFEYRSEEKYLSLFIKNRDEKIVGESSSVYLCSRVAAKEIFNFNPHAKIIIMLREPTDFLHSLHSQYVKERTELVGNFYEAIYLGEDRKKGKHVPETAKAPSLLHYDERAKYSENIERFYNYFPRSQTKIILFEEFKTNNEDIFDEVLAFLNVSRDFRPNYKISNPYRTVKFETPYRAIHNPRLKKIVMQMLPLSVQLEIKKMLDLIFLKASRNKEMESDFRTALKRQFRSEVEKTGRLINRDLIGFWGYEA